MKKVVVAFDSFKGCISAHEACEAASKGIRTVLPEVNVVEIALSDGGEGLVKCVQQMLPTQSVSIDVHGPLMTKLKAEYAMSMDGKTAYMEMAAASGLTLVPIDQRDPTKTTTYGVGEMVADALKRGCQKIVMGIGGSATCDGGRGMIEALRDKGCLEKKNHKDIYHNGHVDIMQKGNECLAQKCKFIVACDVNNPLYGENGAAHIFAPQKGATKEQVLWLDEQLRTFAKETEQAGLATPELANHPGAGAAGGLGYALLAYLNAELNSGIDIVLDLANFDVAIKDADLVITGEGKSDQQTMMGKVPHGVLKRCKKAGVPVWLLSGAIDDRTGELAKNFDLVRSINENDNRPLSVLMQPDVAKKNITAFLSAIFFIYLQIIRTNRNINKTNKD